MFIVVLFPPFFYNYLVSSSWIYTTEFNFTHAQHCVWVCVRATPAESASV
jgi:hypothetical protein